MRRLQQALKQRDVDSVRKTIEDCDALSIASEPGWVQGDAPHALVDFDHDTSCMAHAISGSLVGLCGWNTKSVVERQNDGCVPGDSTAHRR